MNCPSVNVTLSQVREVGRLGTERFHSLFCPLRLRVVMEEHGHTNGERRGLTYWVTHPKSVCLLRERYSIQERDCYVRMTQEDRVAYMWGCERYFETMRGQKKKNRLNSA